MAGEDLDSSLIVPLIKRAEPEGAGGSSVLSWPEGDTSIAEELAGELYVFYGFALPARSGNGADTGEAAEPG